MSLALHLTIHISLALLAGLLVWSFWRRPAAAIAGGLIGGVLIDLDHLIDYVIAFGFTFNLGDFFNGYYGVKNGHIFYLFHGWEYVVILLAIGILIKKHMRLKSFAVALALGMLLHLMIDVTINDGMTAHGYSIGYRVANGFKIEKIVTPEKYQRYLIRKQENNL
jgi:hypothetical protein